jgi:hypothetical protein
VTTEGDRDSNEQRDRDIQIGAQSQRTMAKGTREGDGETGECDRGREVMATPWSTRI